ncbi:MAG: 2-dehydro-3-deoxygalactonokinase, partial [Pseudomonadota bacterium]
GAILAEHKNNAGMRAVARDEFKGVLDQALASMDAPVSGVPVLMCGMVGSRQGWSEAPYMNLPVAISDIAHSAVRVPHVADREVQILPGVARQSTTTPDVMRSEETQLLGLQALDHLSDPNADYLVCMPGSHAKWVSIKDGVMIDFHSAMTGELIAAATTSTVLRHSFDASSGLPDIAPDNPVFRRAVEQALADPTTILNALFVTRARALLNGDKSEQSAAWLSGSVIGHDVGAARQKFKNSTRSVLVGGGKQGPLYHAVMQMAGMQTQIANADDASVAGLYQAACQIWPARFNMHETQRTRVAQ